MKKFISDFYSSRLEDWQHRYVKLRELKKLINVIFKDIQTNGGDPTLLKEGERFSESATPRETVYVDRRSFGLKSLEGAERLFKKDLSMFSSLTMKRIDANYEELNDLQFEYDAKIFLYALEVEIHNVYVFYLGIEKDIYQKTNDHLINKKNYSEMSENEILLEINELIDIAYTNYSLYLYADLNIDAIQAILKYYDSIFQYINNGISMRLLYFNKNLAMKESDFKYLLSFKIINESTALIESCFRDIRSKFSSSKSQKMKDSLRELGEVLSFLDEKNTNRISNKVFEVYMIERDSKAISKNKNDLELKAQDSFLLGVGKAGDEIRALEMKEFDMDINIHTTCQNRMNLFICLFQTFFFSFFYILPYVSFFFFFREKHLPLSFLGLVLLSAHIGVLSSRFLLKNFEGYKCPLLFSFAATLISDLMVVFSEKLKVRQMEYNHNEYIKNNVNVYTNNFRLNIDNKYLYLGINCVARFIFGFGNCRITVRKYILGYVPESLMRTFSSVYIFITFLGILLGVLYNFININILSDFEITLFKIISIDEHGIPYVVGTILSLVFLLITVILFNEPEIIGEEKHKKIRSTMLISGGKKKKKPINSDNININSNSNRKSNSSGNDINDINGSDDSSGGGSGGRNTYDILSANNNNPRTSFYNTMRLSQSIRNVTNKCISISPSQRNTNYHNIVIENINECNDENNIDNDIDNNNENNIDNNNDNKPKSYENNNNLYLENNNKEPLIQKDKKEQLEKKSKKDANKNDVCEEIISKNEGFGVDTAKGLGDRLLNAEELEGLMSFENNIINMNKEFELTNTNIMQKELDIIINSKHNTNSYYSKSILAFIVLLLLGHTINEYILLLTPLKMAESTIITKRGKNIISLAFSVLVLVNFPYMVVMRLYIKLRITRKTLVVCYILMIISVGLIVISYILTSLLSDPEPDINSVFPTYNNTIIDSTNTSNISNSLSSNSSSSFSLNPFIYFILLLFSSLSSSFVLSFSNLLLENIIPPFARICDTRARFVFAFLSSVGRSIATLMFFILGQNVGQGEVGLQNYRNNGNIGFCIIEGVMLICIIFIVSGYSSMRVRAISKLRDY